MKKGDIVLYDHDIFVKIISEGKQGKTRVKLLIDVQAAFFGKRAGDIIAVPTGGLYDRTRYMAICKRLDEFKATYTD